MWKGLEDALQRLSEWSQRTRAERRAAKVRARFWVDLRAGQREAEARARACTAKRGAVNPSQTGGK